MKSYVFKRDGFFYVIELANDQEARENAECNPGTLAVETLSGEVVWKHDERSSSE